MNPALQQVGSTSVGYVLVGASGFALLACGPRLLGSADYSLLAIAWTVTTIVGTGIAQPGEQTITRVIASGGDRHVVRVVTLRLAVVAALALALPALGAFDLDPLLRNSAVWSLTVVVAIAGWAMLVGPRGELAGASHFRSYGVVMAVEAVSRMGLCVAAIVIPSAATALLAGALCLPLVLAAMVAYVMARRLALPPGDPTGRGHGREQGSITAVSLLIQVVLSSAPLWLEVQSTDPALAGAFVTLTSYLRVPLLVVGGIFVVTLSRASAAYAARNVALVRAIAVRAIAGAGFFALLLELLLLLFSGPGLRLFYGSALPLSATVGILVAASTVFAILASTATQVLYGCQRAGAAVVAWALGAIVGTVQMLFLGGDVERAAFAVMSGAAVAALALAVPLWGAVRDRGERALPTGPAR
jgi:O-antigen/teichoic acid export membrane protein